MASSFAADVYGSSMTERQARRLISRGSVVAPRAQGRTSRILTATAAVECESCGNSTMNGMVVGRQYLCLPCAHRVSDDD